MREFKLRAWDRYAKKMCDVYAIDFKIGHLFTDIGDSNLGAEAEALMQSTGLHDKNGVEIFEGDICKIEFGPLEKPYIGSVNFKYGKWMLGNAELFLHSSGCEVIGNIYENPELLEEEK